MNRRTSIRRLLALAAYLRALPPRKFDFERWASDRAKPHSIERVTLDPHKCKTVACAGGWATMIPSFRRAGLHLDEFNVPVIVDRTDAPHSEAGGANAMSVVLGIGRNTAEALFTNPRTYGTSSFSKVTAKMVAKRLEQLAKDLDE